MAVSFQEINVVDIEGAIRRLKYKNCEKNLFVLGVKPPYEIGCNYKTFGWVCPFKHSNNAKKDCFKTITCKLNRDAIL